MCERNHSGERPRADPGGAFRARDVSAATLSPPRRSLGRDPALLRSQRSRRPDFFTGKQGRQGWRCLGEQWVLARVSQTPFGARVVFRKLSTIVVILSKTFNRSFCCSSQGCCLIPLSAFPVGCHHSRVNEKWGNFPEGDG